MKKTVRFAKAIVLGIFGFLTSAILWVLVLCAGGAASIVFGVRMLAGDALAFIVAGIFLLLTAALVRRGLIGG
jgi:hypothetical protein